MRNYNRQYKDMKTYRYDNVQERETRSKVVIDENTIYEIDLDCYDCIQKGEKDK